MRYREKGSKEERLEESVVERNLDIQSHVHEWQQKLSEWLSTGVQLRGDHQGASERITNFIYV